MMKIETIWHHLLYIAINKKQFKFTQSELAREFGYSLSTVNHSLAIPGEIGAIRKESKYFVLSDWQKLIYYWASVRRLEKDVIYKTYLQENISEIEGLVPQEVIYACYSAGKYHLEEAPADYSKVYFYASPDQLVEVQKRFPLNKKIEPNIFVLKMPLIMKKYEKFTTLPQTFVDIWNCPDWYARDFVNALEEKINGILS